MSLGPPANPSTTQRRGTGGLFDNPRPVHALADLLANVWQLGYVTSDLEKGIEFMAERFGLEHCMKLPAGGATFLVGDEPAEWDAKFAMGARGGLIVELIEPVAGEIEFYTRILPQDGSFAVRLHHIATFNRAGRGRLAKHPDPPRRLEPQDRLHGPDPRSGPGRLRRHDGRARPLAGGPVGKSYGIRAAPGGAALCRRTLVWQGHTSDPASSRSIHQWPLSVPHDLPPSPLEICQLQAEDIEFFSGLVADSA